MQFINKSAITGKAWFGSNVQLLRFNYFNTPFPRLFAYPIQTRLTYSR